MAEAGILRVSIVEESCGCPLFDQTWSWKEGQTSPTVIAGLVQFFRRFASNVGGGDVKSVKFEKPDKDLSKPQRPMLNMNGITLTSTQKRALSRKARQQLIEAKKIEMFFAGNDTCVATLCVDNAFAANAAEIVKRIFDAFWKEYGASVLALAPRFAEMADRQKRADEGLREDKDMMSKFVKFEEALGKVLADPRKKASVQAEKQAANASSKPLDKLLEPKSRTSSEAQPVRRDGVDDYSSLAAIESHFAEADWGYDT